MTVRAAALTLQKSASGVTPSWLAILVVCGATSCGSERDTTEIVGVISAAVFVERTLIVFCSDRAEPGVSDLYVMAADGSNVKRLTEGGDFFTPAWSPDGRSIAFQHSTGTEVSIGLLIPGSSERVLLVTGEDPDLWGKPVLWSRDGQQLSYARRESPLSDVWVVSRSGGQRRPLLPAPKGCASLQMCLASIHASYIHGSRACLRVPSTDAGAPTCGSPMASTIPSRRI